MMKGKILKKCTALVLSAIMLFGCAQSVFAVTTNEDLQYSFEPGVVLVRLNPGSPTLEKLLSDFEIAEISRISPGIIQSYFRVKFVQKTKEIVLEAIDILSKSPYVSLAEPNYIGQYLPVTDPTETEATAPDTRSTVPETTAPVTEPTEPETTAPVTDGKLPEDNFEPGTVLVSLKFGAPSFEKLLPGFEITEIRFLTPGSTTRSVWSVRFAQKTKEIVWEAIDILSKSSYVYYAEPNYIGQYLPATDPTNPDTDLKSETENTETAKSVKGDADSDGELTVRDATCIQMYLANFISAQEIDYSAANVSGSGTVSIQDATEIQLKLAGLLNNW